MSGGRRLPRVGVLALGGTIASVARRAPGVAPGLSAEQLVASLPALAETAEITADTFRQLPSPELTVADVIALAEEVTRRIASGDAGVVVTQGTDTLEETAFALDLLVGGDAPGRRHRRDAQPVAAGRRRPGQPAGGGAHRRLRGRARPRLHRGLRRRDPRRALRAEGAHPEHLPVPLGPGGHARLAQRGRGPDRHAPGGAPPSRPPRGSGGAARSRCSRSAPATRAHCSAPWRARAAAGSSSRAPAAAMCLRRGRPSSSASLARCPWCSPRARAPAS